MYTENMQKETATIADLSAAADKLTFTPIVPCEIVEFGVIITTVVVASASTVFKLDKRPTAGSDTGRGDGDLGTGTFVSTLVKTAGSVWRSRPTNPGVLLPGQQAILELTTGATSGAGIGFIVYRNKPVYRDAAEAAVVTA